MYGKKVVLYFAGWFDYSSNTNTSSTNIWKKFFFVDQFLWDSCQTRTHTVILNMFFFPLLSFISFLFFAVCYRERKNIYLTSPSLISHTFNTQQAYTHDSNMYFTLVKHFSVASLLYDKRENDTSHYTICLLPSALHVY